MEQLVGLSTLLEMINDRGFFCERKTTEKIREMFRLQNSIGRISLVDGGKVLKVLITPESMTKNNASKMIKIEIARLGKDDQAVVILRNRDLYNDTTLTSPDDDRMCVFPLKALTHNITKHRWVPSHEKITEREELYILRKYNLDSPLKLPLIDVRDPVIKYYGWKTGDICRITRAPKLYPRNAPAKQNIGSGTGSYVSYRCISNSI